MVNKKLTIKEFIEKYNGTEIKRFYPYPRMPDKFSFGDIITHFKSDPNARLCILLHTHDNKKHILLDKEYFIDITNEYIFHGYRSYDVNNDTLISPEALIYYLNNLSQDGVDDVHLFDGTALLRVKKSEIFELIENKVSFNLQLYQDLEYDGVIMYNTLGYVLEYTDKYSIKAILNYDEYECELSDDEKKRIAIYKVLKCI